MCRVFENIKLEKYITSTSPNELRIVVCWWLRENLRRK